MKKLFVIMPFGEKTYNNQTIDFDFIYQQLIKPIERLKDWNVYRIDEFPNKHKHRPQIRETKVSVKHENFDKRNSLIVLGAGSIGVNQTERGIIPNQFQTIEFLSYPRTNSIDFLKVMWHELEDEIGADWQSDVSWIISG